MVCFDSKICRETGALAPVEDFQRKEKLYKNMTSFRNNSQLLKVGKIWAFYNFDLAVTSALGRVSSSTNRWGWCSSVCLVWSCQLRYRARGAEGTGPGQIVWDLSVHLPSSAHRGRLGWLGCNEVIVGRRSVHWDTITLKTARIARTNNLILNIIVCSGVTTHNGQIEIKGNGLSLKIGQVHS